MTGTRIIDPHGLKDYEFMMLYGTEEQCFEAFKSWRWPHGGFVCPKCGYHGHCVLAHRSLMQCNKCRRQTSITAGTIIGATKMPLTMWFEGLFHLTRNSHPCTSMHLSRKLHISYNAAYRMKTKLMVMATMIPPLRIRR